MNLTIVDLPNKLCTYVWICCFINMLFLNLWMLACIFSSLLFPQLAIQLTCYFKTCNLVSLSTYHFINLLFCQLAISQCAMSNKIPHLKRSNKPVLPILTYAWLLSHYVVWRHYREMARWLNGKLTKWSSSNIIIQHSLSLDGNKVKNFLWRLAE
jgi:hypothetical protein